MRIGASIGTVGLVTAMYVLLVHVNPTTIALTYVVVVLLIATGWGIAESTAASLAAVLCFNFFFLPPVGTFTIADPQNWVALGAFLATAIVASQLSGRARQRNVEALARQRELERLYTLSRALLLSEGGAAVPGAIARRIADAFELPAAGVYDRRMDVVSWAGAGDLPARDAMLREVARLAAPARDGALNVTPIELGGVPIGSVAVIDRDLSPTVLQSIANLAAIGLERARGEEATARAEAARQSSELRAIVLDALAHEFKTPLTSMKAAAADLLTGRPLGERDRELAAIIDEELDRLGELVTNAVHMLRIDAGDFSVNLGRQPLAPLVGATLRKFERQLDGHHVVVRVPADLVVDADPDLLALAVRQLVDNALKYSPPTSTIEISAGGDGTTDIAVRNSGSVIPPHEQPRVFERFYRGAQARQVAGTGMGLGIVQRIAQAHGGAVSMTSAPGAGTAFTISLPHGDRRP